MIFWYVKKLKRKLNPRLKVKSTKIRFFKMLFLAAAAAPEPIAWNNESALKEVLKNALFDDGAGVAKGALYGLARGLRESGIFIIFIRFLPAGWTL